MQFYVFGGLIYVAIKNQKLVLPKGKQIVFLLIYLFSFLIVEFYAIDKGMNLLAFFKNLMILFFLLLYIQYDNNEKEIKRRLELIPYAACTNLILSFFIILFPDNRVFFNGRLQGLFEYANSYGLFLLIGITIIANKEKLKWYDFVVFEILALGIILTNSRAIIILTAFALLVSLFTNKANIKKTLIMLVSVVALFGIIYAFSQIEKRVSSDMLESSEFSSRLLYYSDALNMIKDNPFGYGYIGWHFKQAEIKTGVYDTKYVHNSVLQVMLDVGIIPTIALFIMLAFIFFDKKQTPLTRLILMLILGHSIVDIDLEYMYFLLIIILLSNFNSFEVKNDSIIKKVILVGSGVIIIPYFMIFLSDLNYAVKNYKNAVDIVPFHSEAVQSLLYSVKTKEEHLKYAHEALKYNEIVSGAYEAISNDLQDKEQFVEALELEKKRLGYNKYEMSYYMNFAEFLTKSFNYYTNKKDFKTAKIFIDELLKIEDNINLVIENTNPLCYKTIHTPELEINKPLRDLIDQAQQMSKKIEDKI